MPVRPRPLIATLALAAAVSSALVTAPASAAASAVKGNDWPHPDLTKAYNATVKYTSEQAALNDGYLRTDECVEDPTLGGMGYHYVKPAHIGSTDPTRPAALLYEDDHHGKRQLVAVEYIVLNTGQPRPRMFDRDFDGPAVLPGLGSHYSLHAWIFKKNPKGVFTPYNPRVTCDCPPDMAKP
ncbi:MULTISPECIES: hypothetical protein [Streptomyces]|uniref:hypothetical protein n=1 Tax=Streptomyces TaxID=1883 RepID=UPI001315EEA6|nr:MULTISPECIES: hypothetical protein [Streptomyces]QGZ50350.1 hypothetical protein GPZ77_20040 [Streptomyces sp. QHH-9511]GGT87852.1 hypothetical protein GCM10010272_35780 [Streptomyces lateritius]